MFGTNGIRGVAGASVNAEFAFKLGSSIAGANFGKTVLVGRDGRVSSPMLTEGLVAGVLSRGVSVQDCGLITTPGLQFLVKASSKTVGVMVTASHNPPEYNGFKVVDSDGIEIPRAKEQTIERLLTKESWPSSKSTGQRTYYPQACEAYLEGLARHMGKSKARDRVTVVIDTGNGVAALTTPVLLSRFGCKVITMNDNIDGRFPGRTSEPRPENLGPLAEAVKREKASFGVAHDGDGDRAIFVGEDGEVYSGDQSMSLIEDEILKKNPGGRMVTPVNSSMSVAEVAERRSGKLTLTPVGSIHVARTMIAQKAVLGGEENGGIFYSPHQPVRDGAMATVLILNSILENRTSLSKLMGRLPRFYMFKQKRNCPDNRKMTVITVLRKRLADRVSSTVDGVRVDLKNRGWFLVRASGTEPLVRVYFEGKTELDLERIRNEFTPLIDEAIGV